MMSVLFLIPGPLRGFAGGCSEVRLDESPGDVGHALAGLWALAPALRDRILDEQGQIRQHVNLFVGTESIRFTGGLATPVTDGTAIMIVPAVSGG
jgi:molybdopterin converting factor small subunit